MKQEFSDALNKVLRNSSSGKDLSDNGLKLLFLFSLNSKIQRHSAGPFGIMLRVAQLEKNITMKKK